jgi:hypothetical protein
VSVIRERDGNALIDIAPSRTKALQASLTLRKFVGDLEDPFAPS